MEQRVLHVVLYVDNRMVIPTSLSFNSTKFLHSLHLRSTILLVRIRLICTSSQYVGSLTKLVVCYGDFARSQLERPQHLSESTAIALNGLH